MRISSIVGWALLAAFALAAGPVSAAPGFIYGDALAPRDEWGRLHQSPVTIPTDFEPRSAVRFHYYFKGARTLQADPAYVAAVQTALRQRGYYCGESDGIYSTEVSDGIARLQKNHALIVDGRLNLAVRRALRLP